MKLEHKIGIAVTCTFLCLAGAVIGLKMQEKSSPKTPDAMLARAAPSAGEEPKPLERKPSTQKKNTIGEHLDETKVAPPAPAGEKNHETPGDPLNLPSGNGGETSGSPPEPPAIPPSSTAEDNAAKKSDTKAYAGGTADGSSQPQPPSPTLMPTGYSEIGSHNPPSGEQKKNSPSPLADDPAPTPAPAENATPMAAPPTMAPMPSMSPVVGDSPASKPAKETNPAAPSSPLTSPTPLSLASPPTTAPSAAISPLPGVAAPAPQTPSAMTPADPAPPTPSTTMPAGPTSLPAYPLPPSSDGKIEPVGKPTSPSPVPMGAAPIGSAAPEAAPLTTPPPSAPSSPPSSNFAPMTSPASPSSPAPATTPVSGEKPPTLLPPVSETPPAGAGNVSPNPAPTSAIPTPLAQPSMPPSMSAPLAPPSSPSPTPGSGSKANVPDAAAASRIAPLPMANAPAPAQPASAVEPQVVVFSEKEYRCQPGDTFETLSQRFMGSSKYAAALRRHNQNHARASRQMESNGQLVPGERIFIPPPDVLARRYPDAINQTPASSPGAVPASFNSISNQPPPRSLTPMPSAPPLAPVGSPTPAPR